MGVREDAINVVDALGRADDLSLKFRQAVGIDARRARDAGRAWTADDSGSGLPTSGVELRDIDLLLRRRQEESWSAGYDAGSLATADQMGRQHEAEIGTYVGSVCDLVSRELLAAVVTAAVQANESKATKQGLVDAVVARVKREAAAMDDMAARARRGELFS